jgi:hydroxymethylbilane synthase
MTSLPDRIVVASRGSELALRQTHIVVDLIERAHPGIEIEILEVTTKGDNDQRPFAQIGGKGLFTSEIERRVAAGEADIAVHSAKDLTAELAPGCTIACIPERAAANDVVVGGFGESGEERLMSLPAGARVGTSSMRRRSLLLELRDDVEVADLRGNLDTRLRKVKDGEVDVAILAMAGLLRIGRADEGAALDESRWIPAPAQGALAVECLARRADLLELLAPIEDKGARAEVEAERSFAAAMEGGCSVPLGCRARLSAAGLVVDGFLGTADGVTTLRDRISGSPGEAVALGRELAEAILAAGGDDILDEVKDSPAPSVQEP